MPNFVDCAVFRQAASELEKKDIRKNLAIPEAAMVIISVAALKRGHKRVDHVITEFQAAARADSFLLLVGAATDETPGLLDLAGGDSRIRILQNFPHEKMPELLRAADVMVLGSLFEMMPIAVLEALASGLPCLVNQHPVLEWMVGTGENALEVRRETLDAGRREEKDTTPLPSRVSRLTSHPSPPASRVSRLTSHISPLPGGMALDMNRPGVLAQALAGLTPEWIAEHGSQARARALAMFSKETVIRQYVEYYRAIMKDEG